MKKTLFTICVAALAVGCAKTEVQFEQADAISFAPVAHNATKAAVESGAAPGCALLVSANAGTAGAAASTYGELYFDEVTFTGNTEYTAPGYFWPNVKHLSFAGITQSAGISTGNVEIDVDANTITVTDYPQQAVGTEHNDLMWFGQTAPAGKTTSAIEVDMMHACSWIVLNFYGDETAGNTTRPWKITNVTINDLAATGKAILGSSASWPTGNLGSRDKDLVVYNNGTGKEMQQSTKFVPSADGIIVIPQRPTSISVTYNYLSQGINTPNDVTDDIVIEEIATVNLNYDGTSTNGSDWTSWAAGTKYTYDIKLTATGIKIAPTASAWTPYDHDSSTNGTQTIPGTI